VLNTPVPLLNTIEPARECSSVGYAGSLMSWLTAITRTAIVTHIPSSIYRGCHCDAQPLVQRMWRVMGVSRCEVPPRTPSWIQRNEAPRWSQGPQSTEV